METIVEKLSVIMKSVFENENIVVTRELTAKDVEKWTSMTNVIFISEVEKAFNFRFHFREIMNLNNVGDLIDLIQKKTA